MTMRERFRAMFVPELQAAYRLRDEALELRDQAADRAAELADQLTRERVYSDFWAAECSRAERRFLLLTQAVEAAGDAALIEKAQAILRWETS